MVVLDKGALSLKDSDSNSCLLVLVSCEGLGLLSWDDGTTLDNWSHDSSDGLNTERKWSNVNEKNILSLLCGLASENTSLHSSTESNGLIWVDATVWFLSVEIFLKK